MVTWAQRPKLIFLTVCLSDCKDPNIKVEKDKLSFKAVGGTEKKEHAVDIIFFKEIDPEASVTTSVLSVWSLFLNLRKIHDLLNKSVSKFKFIY